jgi:hypothetical protein
MCGAYPPGPEEITSGGQSQAGRFREPANTSIRHDRDNDHQQPSGAAAWAGAGAQRSYQIASRVEFPQSVADLGQGTVGKPKTSTTGSASTVPNPAGSASPTHRQRHQHAVPTRCHAEISASASSQSAHLMAWSSWAHRFLDLSLSSVGEGRLRAYDYESCPLQDLQRSRVVTRRAGEHGPDMNRFQEEGQRSGSDALPPERPVDPVSDLGVAVDDEAGDTTDEPSIERDDAVGGLG